MNMRALLAKPGVCITDRSNIHSEQLELGAHVRARKKGAGAAQSAVTAAATPGLRVPSPTRGVPRANPLRHARHVVSGCHETENPAAPECAFANSVDVRIGSPTVIIDHDAAALADRKPGCPGQLVTRTDACREDDDIRLE